MAIRRNGIIDQPGKPDTPLDRFVVDKMNFGNNPQVQSARQLGSQESRRVFEPLLSSRDRFPVAQYREKDLGMAMIICHFDGRERHHADSGILDLGPNQIGEITLDLVPNAPKSRGTSGHFRFGAPRNFRNRNRRASDIASTG
jgi:hypothetical protein